MLKMYSSIINRISKTAHNSSDSKNRDLAVWQELLLDVQIVPALSVARRSLDRAISSRSFGATRSNEKVTFTHRVSSRILGAIIALANNKPCKGRQRRERRQESLARLTCAHLLRNCSKVEHRQWTPYSRARGPDAAPRRSREVPKHSPWRDGFEPRRT